MSRRGFLGAAGSAGAALTLAACGGTGASSVTTSRESSQEAASVSSSPYRSQPGLHPPPIHVRRRPAHPGTDAYVLTDAHAGKGQQGPMIIDRGGRLKWFMPVSDGGSTHKRVMNLRVQSYRGQPVITFWIGGLLASHGVGHYEIYDTSYRKVAEVHAGDGLRGDLHEFLLTPQGTALFTAYGVARGRIPTPDDAGTREAAYFYCCCQEVDVASGELLLNWRSDKQPIPFSASRRLPTPGDPTTPWDYFHMNSINIDPSDGNLIISSRNLWQVYKVQRQTGKLMWRMGGIGSDFEIDRRAHYAFQHHVTPHANSVYTIFDNEAGPPDVASQSRGLVIKVDEKRRKVHFMREYHHDPAVLSDALGSVQPLAGGEMFIGWGESSWFTQWNARGDVLLDARLPGVISYRAFLQPWEATPAEPPRFAVERVKGRLTVYASWNGATVHRKWRVLGGASAGALQSLQTAPVDGFEAAIVLSHSPRWLAVEALDAKGDVVGRSEALRVKRPVAD